jgi:hypothetical protein
MRKRHALRVALLCALVSVLVGAGSASADVYMAPPGPALSPDLTTTTSLGGVQPMTAASGNYICGSTWPWTTTANNYNSWAIGNCAASGNVYRTDQVGPVNGSYWDGGHIEGGVGYCGFVDDLYVQYTSPGTHSACAYADPSAFQQAGSTCTGSVGDGCLRNNSNSCPEYANYQPWAPYSQGGSTPASLIRTEPAGSNSLLYRYRARYPTTGSVYYDMVRDGNVNSGYGNWVFVPDTCF